MKAQIVVVGIGFVMLAVFASGVEFSAIEIAGKRVTICRVNVTKERLQLFRSDEIGQPFKRFDHLATWLEPRNEKLVFAMNGGMFHSDFSAVGLFVSDGKQLASLNPSNGVGNFFLKPNGVFLVSKAGARIVESSEFSQLDEKVLIATQSGPLLVQNGKIHPAFKADSSNRFIRNGGSFVTGSRCFCYQ